MLQKVNDKTVLTDKSYGVSTKLVQVWIPATSSLYFGLSAIWDLPYTQQIVGTLALVATFLGLVLHISGSNYDASGAGVDGNMVVSQQDGGALNYSMEYNDDPSNLQNKNKVTFKVVSAPTVPQDAAPPADFPQ